MTIRKLKDQENIIVVPEPTGDREVPFIDEGNRLYHIVPYFKNELNYTQIYSKNVSGSSISDTWTVPEIGVYTLQIDTTSTADSLEVMVDSKTVEQVSNTNTIKTTRVLYTGSKITFNGSNGSNIGFNSRVQQYDDTYNVDPRTGNYFEGDVAYESDDRTAYFGWPTILPYFTVNKQ